MYFVYILRSKRTNRHYIGYTNDLNRRLREHNSRKTKSLIKDIPLEIIYKEEYKTVEESRKRERQIKKYKSGEAFKKLINSRLTPTASQDR